MTVVRNGSLKKIMNNIPLKLASFWALVKKAIDIVMMQMFAFKRFRECDQEKKDFSLWSK